MDITWYGLACFRMTERGNATIVTDPFDDSVGLRSPRLKADIVSVSHDAPGHSNVSAVKGAHVLDGPGEYEIGGAFITSIATANKNGKNNIFVFEVEGLNVAHFGDIDHVPSQSRLEGLGTVDVALVPVGGGSSLNASEAAELIRLLEPSIVIPMHYKTDDLGLKLDTLGKFLKEMGIANATPQDSLKVTKNSLPEETQVVVLSLRDAQ